MASTMQSSRMQAWQIAQYNEPYTPCERPIPKCSDTNLLIKVHAAGYCHSDYQVWQGQFAASLPIIPSHEPAGTIVQVGTRVKGSWKVGDRVGVLNFKNACETCPGCTRSVRKKKRADPRFCENREMAGFKHDGAFAQYMIADPETTVHLPTQVSFTQGAPLMCAGATAWGALQKLRPEVQSGEPVAIVGIGGVGHLAIQFAKALGYRTVAIDNRAEGRQLAMEVPDSLKPDLIVDSLAGDADERILEFTKGEGLSGVVVCTDAISANAWSLQQLGNGGVLVPLGLPKDRWQFDSSKVVFRELIIKGNYVSSKEEAEAMFKVVAEHNVASHLTVVPFEELPSVIERYTDKAMKGRLVVQVAL